MENVTTCSDKLGSVQGYLGYSINLYSVLVWRISMCIDVYGKFQDQPTLSKKFNSVPYSEVLSDRDPAARE